MHAYAHIHAGIHPAYVTGERIPGLGNMLHDINVPSKQAGMKINWYMQVAEYFNYKYASGCANPYDAEYAFTGLTGDV